MIFLSLLFVPIFIAAGLFVFTKHLIVWQEFVGQLAISIVIAAISVGILYYANTHDEEVWGGKVTSKASEKVPCSHHYCCGWCESCTTDAQGNSSCTSYCCTWCDEHPYDIDWAYYTSDNDRDTVSRLDSQGVEEPPRWTKILVGEPSASKHSYDNYIKASPDSLFSYQGLVEEFKDKLPIYPDQIFDLYHINRLVTVGATVSNPDLWNKTLMQQNGSIGAQAEVSMAVVLVEGLPYKFFNALQQHWLGGKKNDFILVVGISGLTVQWADVMAWSDNKIAEIKVRDIVLGIKTIDNPISVVNAMADIVKQDFHRKPMDDFKYLKSSIKPKPWQFILALIINILVSIVSSIIFLTNNIRED